ncbi:TPA: hypothetical protein RXU85_003108 [Escherichia coli]|nr:hypothetical protein [Escherichia coli]
MRYAHQAYKIYCNMLNLRAFVGRISVAHPALGAQCLMRYAYQAYKIYCNMLNLHAFVGG